jgi:hypothetical protein
MDKYDWKANIKMNILMLQVCGLWPKGDETYKPGIYALQATILLTVFLMGHMFCQVVKIYFIRDNLEAITGSFYVLLVEMLVVFKVYYLIKNMETFLTMSYCYNLFCVLFPLLDKTAEEKRLPFLAWYPYNTQISPFYQITYIHQIASVVFITTVHVNIDTLVAAINAFNGSQFDILCDNLRNLHNLTGSEDINDKLINCIEHHKQTLRYETNFSLLSIKFRLSVIPKNATIF